MPRVVVVSDADYWGDDANALLMLLASRQIAVEAVVATSGNVWSADALQNLRRVLALAGRGDLPLYSGMPAGHHAGRQRHYRLHEAPRKAVAYAGALGFDPLESPDATAPAFPTTLFHERPGELSVVLLGPATALAAALRTDPALAGQIRHLYWMGGALDVPGNATRAAEFNFWFDPEAARDVLAAGIPTTLAPLDCTTGVIFSAETLRCLQVSTGATARHVMDYVERRRQRRPDAPLPLWDEVLAAVLLQPGLVRKEKQLPLTVCTNADDSYGALIRHSGKTASNTVRVILEVDADALNKLLCTQLAAPAREGT